MEDLLALVELFGLKVTGRDVDLLYSHNSIPTISVEGGNGPVFIANVDGRFRVTERIDGVPMRFIGMGSWNYLIDI